MTDTKDQQAVTVAQEDREALERVERAIKITMGDTMGRIGADERVIWTASGSWTGSQGVTIGDIRAVVRLASVSSASAEIPAGMKPWTGGDSAPDDWDGGSVLRADGQTEHPDDITIQQWKHPVPRCKWNVVAYTPARVLKFPEPVPATNQAGEAGVGQLRKIVIRHTVLGAYPDTMAIARDAQTLGLSDYNGLRHLLLNLLATVHRDGGQYVDTHGEFKATEDAVQIVASLLSANPAVAFTQKVANLAGDELDAHASPELRDLALAALATQPATSQEGAPEGMDPIREDPDAPERNGHPCWLWHRLWAGPVIGHYDPESQWWRMLTGNLNSKGDLDMTQWSAVGIFPSHWCTLKNIPDGHKVPGWGYVSCNGDPCICATPCPVEPA